MVARRDRQEDASNGKLADAYETFVRLRERHSRFARVMRRREAEADALSKQSRGRVTIAAARDRVEYHPAWSRWSESYDEVASAADRLLRSRPRSLADLLLMFSALEWILLADAVIVDREAERQVRRFGRSLRRLVADRS
jgi:hypothetical protein